jgi:hypothetical protein
MSFLKDYDDQPAKANVTVTGQLSDINKFFLRVGCKKSEFNTVKGSA